jgi:hypothetical protein
MTMVAAKLRIGGEATHHIEESGLDEGTPQNDGSPARSTWRCAGQCWSGGREFCHAGAGGR